MSGSIFRVRRQASDRGGSGHSLFTRADLDDVQRFFESRPDLTPTPLVRLPGLTADAGLTDLLVKDESTRFGLNAFKIVGVAYAVDRLLSGAHASVRTLVCATEGNHGRAVARVAREREVRAVVYMRRSATDARVDAIRGEGAEIVLVDGTYDDAVRRMASEASRTPGMRIVSDTAWPGYEAIPRAIMAGYTWIMTEASRQWTAGAAPDIVVAQAGVGAFAGAVASWLQLRGEPRPLFICAEPTAAPCVRASLEAGHAVSLVPADTIMAGLRSGEVSSIALPVLATTVDVCITVDDESVLAAIQRLGHPIGNDEAIEAGASGACGLAALLAWTREANVAPGSRALVINTEGAVHPAREARGGPSGPRHRPA
jgi:diaminopropionate ammonia-lyase